MSLRNFTARASALAIMALVCIASPTPFAAAQEPQTESRQFSAKAGDVVLKAQAHINDDAFAAALALLANIEGLTELTPFERSVIEQMRGMSYYQLGEYGPAISAFERAVAADGLRPKEANDIGVKIAQLMIANGQYRQGAHSLEAYINGGGELKPQYIEMLMQAWIQAEDYSKALPWAEKWFAGARPKERKHFDLMNFLHSQLQQPQRQIDIVKDMIKHWPNEKTLWESWASLLAMTGQEKEAFEVTKQIYLSGFEMNERELMKIVQYYSYYDMPYQAAGLLEKEMNMGLISRSPEKLEQLASLLRQAREYDRAIPILEAATIRGGKASSYAQLGEALYNEGQCGRAETAFKQAIDRGYDAGKAWMFIATCRYEDVQQQEKLNCKMSDAEKAAAPKTLARQSTIAAFEKISPISPQSRDAKKWISFITAEREVFDKQCAFRAKVLKDECMKEIGWAYTGNFLDNNFTVSEKCRPYRVEYDQKYRVRVTG